MDAATDNIALAHALWPNASWTQQLTALWRDRLGGLNQELVTEAIKTTKPKYASHQPEIKWVLERYAELYEQRHPTFGRDSRENATPTWHVSWQRTSKHGVPGAWYGKRCASREEADDLAQSMGGRAICMDPTVDPFSEIETRREVEAARVTLTELGRERVGALLERIRSVGFCKPQLPGRVCDWPRMAVLAVYAEHLNQQERSQ